MLKYKLNIDNVISDTEKIKPIFVRIDDYGFVDHFVVSIMHDGNHIFERGDIINVEHFSNIDSKTHRKSIGVRTYDEYIIQDSDQNANIITINVPKKYPIEIDSIIFDYTDKENKTLLLNFKNNHYFSFGDICDISINLTDNGESIIKEIRCDFVDEKTLKWVFDITDENQSEVLNYLFTGGVYYQVGADETVIEYSVLESLPDPVLFTSPNYVKIAQNALNANSGVVYRKSVGTFDKIGEIFLRDNFLFTDLDNVTILANSPSFTINIPLQQNFDTKTYRDVLLKEKITSDITKEIITEGNSVEKDIYYPALIDEYGKTFLVKRIKFNLHFRKRDLTNGWSSPDDEEFWNGTDDSDPIHPQISLSAYNDQMTNTISQFVDNRSDLLTKIGFTNNDVKFQKSRLKKSFLRVSYFSSTNPATQLLIGYSTIFVDTGKLLSKFIKHSHSKNYYEPLPDNQHSQADIQSGFPISVDKEPYDISGITNDNDFEDLRLSTQFVVSNRFSTSSSSEGFYIYLYKDYSSELPKDLYMRVEFNHAGYGKKVPFFMPSYINFVDQHTGIKTYQQILDDWQTQNSGYGFDFYNAYSYIHLKYKYDFSTKKHIYYIDDEYYGTDVLYNGKNEITINLYEPKVNI